MLRNYPRAALNQWLSQVSVGPNAVLGWILSAGCPPPFQGTTRRPLIRWRRNLTLLLTSPAAAGDEMPPLELEHVIPIPLRLAQRARGKQGRCPVAEDNAVHRFEDLGPHNGVHSQRG